MWKGNSKNTSRRHSVLLRKGKDGKWKLKGELRYENNDIVRYSSQYIPFPHSEKHITLHVNCPLLKNNWKSLISKEVMHTEPRKCGNTKKNVQRQKKSSYLWSLTQRNSC